MAKPGRNAAPLSGWVGAFLLALTAIASWSCSDEPAERIQHDFETHPAAYVDPLIGTAGEGYTFPGPVLPHGLASPSPHNLVASIADYVGGKPIAPAGYRHGEKKISGFGMVHLSGVGCPDFGAPTVIVGDGPSAYSKEKASAGRYEVHLDDVPATVRLTATERVAVVQVLLPEGGTVTIDAGASLSWGPSEGELKAVEPNKVFGSSTTGGFCARTNKQTVYFAAVVAPSADNVDEVGARAVLHFAAKTTVTLRIGLSMQTPASAMTAATAAASKSTFAEIATAAETTWNDALGAIQVAGGTDNQRKLFYTALYHALIHPTVATDTSEPRRYHVHSMWDTYRNLHPLLTLAYPDRHKEILDGLAAKTIADGKAPQWELAGQEVNMMVGDPALAVFADAALKGVAIKDTEKLFKVLLAGADDTKSKRRPANDDYIKLGYVPMDRADDAWGPVSTTLEYAHHDWALAQWARKLGKTAAADRLEKRAAGWKKLFDPKTGLLRPKNRDGSWHEPFDPDALTGSHALYKNSGGPGFVEGTAWHYRFFVPHDMSGLIKAHGEANFDKRFTALFNGVGVAGKKPKFALWNEPTMAFPWLDSYRPERQAATAARVALVRDTYFSTKPDGLPGNDDCGTMSAWIVWSMMGLYPDCPGRTDYAVGAPVFDAIRIQPPGAKQPVAVIEASSTAPARSRIDHVELTNGKPLALRR